MTRAWTRRSFLRSAARAGAWALSGCGDNAKTAALREKAKRLGATLDCSDVSGLQPAEAATREENQYRQHTERDDQFCLGCLNFQPAALETTCATCKTVR